MSHERYRDGEIVISTDPARQDIDGIHAFLTRCYWAEGIPKEIVERSMRHSLCFGVFDGPDQVGFARVITDYGTYAYIGDVYILDSHRGRGLSKRLMQCIMEHEDLQGLRRWSLLTRDAHGLYRQFGFTDVARPERYMEIAPGNIYKR